MKYDTKKEFLSYVDFMVKIGIFKEIGVGSLGLCYLNIKNNKVYKIFHQFFDDEYDYDAIYKKEEILKFSNIVNDTFVWAKDVIIVDNNIVGYISDYVSAKPLYHINPLEVNLDHFTNSVCEVEKDIKIISDNGICTYDVIYNTLYGKKGIFVVDHDEYSYSDLDSLELFDKNTDRFNYGIMLFLVDNYFDEFVNSYKELKEMYCSNGININEFIILFRKYLNEYVGHEITKLNEASGCLNKGKIRKKRYERILFDCYKSYWL